VNEDTDTALAATTEIITSVVRDRCAAILDALAAAEDVSRDFARTNGNTDHENMARAMAKAYRHGAAEIRKAL
jgi:hypothetical protein